MSISCNEIHDLREGTIRDGTIREGTLRERTIREGTNSWRDTSSGDGVVVRALASPQCDQDFDSRTGRYHVARAWCWFCSLLREVFLRVLRFSPLLKTGFVLSKEGWEEVLFVLYVKETFCDVCTICHEIHHIGLMDTFPKRHSPWNAECIFANFSPPELVWVLPLFSL